MQVALFCIICMESEVIGSRTANVLANRTYAHLSNVFIILIIGKLYCISLFPCKIMVHFLEICVNSVLLMSHIHAAHKNQNKFYLIHGIGALRHESTVCDSNNTSWTLSIVVIGV